MSIRGNPTLPLPTGRAEDAVARHAIPAGGTVPSSARCANRSRVRGQSVNFGFILYQINL